MDYKFSFGDKIVYNGPEDLPSPYSAPTEWKGPFQFQHVSIDGTLTLETKFKGRKYLSPDHPANNSDYWGLVDS